MTDQPPNECRIDDFGPLIVVQPQSIAELTDQVRRCAAEGQAIYPLGGRTMLEFGLPPTRKGFAIDLRGLAQVIDYPARDMTITVQAGITMAQLQTHLRGEQQRLPIDIPLADQATLGGALTTNMSGPRRYGFGTLRDYVIGISVVNDEGQEVKAGGRVVKNVAGYDLCKLYTGSLGTLGIITQVTLKLKPVPGQSTLVLLPCPGAKLGALLDQLHATQTRPACLSACSPGTPAALPGWPESVAPPADYWSILVGFEDNPETVAWQVEQLRREVTPLGIDCEGSWTGAAAEPLWTALANFPLALSSPLTFKANLLPQATAAFCQQAAQRSEVRCLLAHAGNGIVVGHGVGDLTLDRAQAMLKSLQASAVAAQGNLVLLRCPPAWKQTLPVWGAPRGDSWLMREIKNKLDPHRRFNTGRFVDGI